MAELAPEIPSPREQLPVTLFGGVVLVVRADDRRIYLCLRDLCDALGLSVSSQRRRIVHNHRLYLTPFRVASGAQFCTLDFLLFEDLPLWILTVQERQVHKEAREKFVLLQEYLMHAAHEALVSQSL